MSSGGSTGAATPATSSDARRHPRRLDQLPVRPGDGEQGRARLRPVPHRRSYQNPRRGLSGRSVGRPHLGASRSPATPRAPGTPWPSRPSWPPTRAASASPTSATTSAASSASPPATASTTRTISTSAGCSSAPSSRSCASTRTTGRTGCRGSTTQPANAVGDQLPAAARGARALPLHAGRPGVQHRPADDPARSTSTIPARRRRYTNPTEYLLGPDVLVAPVTKPGTVQHAVGLVPARPVDGLVHRRHLHRALASRRSPYRPAACRCSSRPAASSPSRLR